MLSGFVDGGGGWLLRVFCRWTVSAHGSVTLNRLDALGRWRWPAFPVGLHFECVVELRLSRY